MTGLLLTCRRQINQGVIHQNKGEFSRLKMEYKCWWSDYYHWDITVKRCTEKKNITSLQLKVLIVCFFKADEFLRIDVVKYRSCEKEYKKEPIGSFLHRRKSNQISSHSWYKYKFRIEDWNYVKIWRVVYVYFPKWLN